MSDHLPESSWHPSWLNKTCTTRKDSESEWLAKDNPETNPITIKLETASHVAEQFSWVLWPSCSPPRSPFPMKSLALPARVSPRTIHFWVLDQSQVSGPGRGPPSCNTHTHTQIQPKPKSETQILYQARFYNPHPPMYTYCNVSTVAKDNISTLCFHFYLAPFSVVNWFRYLFQSLITKLL